MKIILLNQILCLFLITNSSFGQGDQTQTFSLFDVYLSIPTNDSEFKNMFGREPNLNDQKIYELSYPDEQKSSVVQGKSLEDFKKTVKMKSEGYNNHLIIIGHNEDGLFTFPNGEKVKISEIEKLLQKVKGVFISCNSRDYISDPTKGLASKLTYDEAIKLSQNIELGCNHFFMTPQQIDETIIKNIQKFELNRKIKRGIVISGALAGTAGLVYISTKEDDSEKDKE